MSFISIILILHIINCIVGVVTIGVILATASFMFYSSQLVFSHSLASRRLYLLFLLVFNFSKSFYARGFVNRFAIWSFVDMACIDIFPWSNCSLKCQYLPFIYLVLGLIFGMVAIVIASALSSKNFTAHLGAWIKSAISCSTISLIKSPKVLPFLVLHSSQSTLPL